MFAIQFVRAVKIRFFVVVPLLLLIGGGYLSNMLTFIACEEELLAFSKEQWKVHGTGGTGYVGELKQRMPFVVEIECHRVDQFPGGASIATGRATAKRESHPSSQDGSSSTFEPWPPRNFCVDLCHQ